MTHINLITLVGGLCLFLYGINSASENMKLLAGDRLRHVISRLTGNRFAALTVGVLITTMLQSSSAATVMLIGFTSAGLVTLPACMGIILGADVGTTLTVQLISFKVSEYSLVLVAAGFFANFVGKRHGTRSAGALLMGVGLIFFGMDLMSKATYPIRSYPHFDQVMQYLAGHPIATVLASAAFTGVIQASAATIGLLISLSFSANIDMNVAVPVILGANIGTCVTALLAWIGAKPDGKRVAIAHIGFKIAGTILVLPFLVPFVKLVSLTADDPARLIANAHTIFNVGLALVFLPFTNLSASLVTRFYHGKKAEKEVFGPKYLDRNATEMPALAFANALREILRMADIVKEMFVEALHAIKKNDLDIVEAVEARDDQVDILDREIKFYLASISKKLLSDEQAHRELQYVTLTANLEVTGDIINKIILELARKKISKGLHFSEEGWREIRDFHAKVMENFDVAIAAFSSGDEELARRVLRNKEAVRRMEQQLKQAHLDRLHLGLKESFETSSIHLELLSNLRRVNSYITGFAYVTIEMKAGGQGGNG